MAQPVVVVIDVRHAAEVIADLRREMAELLRRQADEELSPAFGRRLLAIADLFETGLSEPPQ